jgi:hypothetical protein
MDPLVNAEQRARMTRCPVREKVYDPADVALPTPMEFHVALPTPMEFHIRPSTLASNCTVAEKVPLNTAVAAEAFSGMAR